MIRVFGTSVLVVVIAAACGSSVFAQEFRADGQRIQPKPLEATDPLAVRAAALARHILAGDKAAALKQLQAEGDEAYLKGGQMEKHVENHVARLAKGKYAIDRFETGLGSDVVVLLKNKEGQDANIVVRYNADKKITGFAQVQIEG